MTQKRYTTLTGMKAHVQHSGGKHLCTFFVWGAERRLALGDQP